MNKNIRRSIAVAATAGGMWALGTAAASAAELPVSVPLSTPDAVSDTVEDVKDTEVKDVEVRDIEVKDVEVRDIEVKDVDADVKDVAHDVHHHGVQGVAEQAHQYAEAQLPAYDLPAAPSAADAPSIADAQDEVDYLFGPLSAFASELEQDAGPGPGPRPGRGRGRHPARPRRHPGRAAAHAARAVDGVLPVAGQAVATSAVSPRALVGDVTPFAGGVVGDVTPFAHGVVGDVAPFAGGVVSEVQPFAQDLSGTVASTPLAGNAVSGAPRTRPSRSRRGTRRT